MQIRFLVLFLLLVSTDATAWANNQDCETLFQLENGQLEFTENLKSEVRNKTIRIYDKNKNELGRVFYFIDEGDTLVIENMKSEKKKIGIQTRLFREILLRHPHLKRARAEILRGDNLQIFSQKLLELGKKYTNFHRQNKTDLFPPQLFEACCKQLSEKEKMDLVREALTYTPAFKIRKKFGFTKICPEPDAIYFSISSLKMEFSIGFDACR